MKLSLEEKKRIYEEEKARIEAREQIEQEKRNEVASQASTGFTPNVAGLICYIGAWITGIVMFVLEQKDDSIRFHAAQSIVVFGTLTVAGVVLGWLPYVGGMFIPIIAIVGVILWIILMLKAYNGERYKLVWAGDIAEKIAASGKSVADGNTTIASAVSAGKPAADKDK
jgi:uncharacterized membrane protein